MKRLINFRSFVYSSVMLMATILFCLLALNVAWLGFILLILVVFAPIVVAALIKKKIETYKFVTILLTACLSIIAVICFFVTVYSWRPSQIDNGVHYVSGTVEDNYMIDASRKVILQNIKIDNKAVNGRIQLTVNDNDGIFEAVSIGDKLDFSAYIFVRDLVSDYSINASYLRSDIRYTATVNSAHIKISKGSMNLSQRINSYIKSTLIDCMGSKYGAVAYGILTGDKNEISSSVRDSFAAAGIAHILAVSGLHIGFLMAIVTFLLRKLKVKRLPTFIIDSTVLIIYSLFAGFSPSVVRACLMFLVGSGAMLLGEEKDSLNSLGLAATVILTVSPIMLFEAGFIMSIGAVFGLINFTPFFERALLKLRLPEKATKVISVPVAAQLGVLPATIYFFGSIQTYSIIINILLMPLMIVAFMSIFISLLISLIIPIKLWLTVSGYFVRGLTVAADLFASLPLAQLPIKSSLIAFMIYPIYFVMGDFFGYKKKRVLVPVSIAVIVILVLFLMVI